MKDLWLTYDVPEGGQNVMSIIENCIIDEDDDGNTVIKGGNEIKPTLGELKKIAQIFNDAVANIEKGE